MFGKKGLSSLTVMDLGGWMLVYAALTMGSLLMTLDWCREEYSIFRNVPSARPGTALPLLLGLCWFVVYSAVLLCLSCRMRRAVTFTKIMIVITPFFHAFLPLIHLLSMVLATPRPEFITLDMVLGDTVGNLMLLAQYYPPELVFVKLPVSFIMAAVWYRYFSVSRRVAEFCAQGGERA